MAIACPVFSSFSLEKSQGIKRGHFIVLRCAHPRIIIAVSTVVSTLRLLTSPHARYNPQPTRQIAVCRLPVRGTQTGGTGRR
jgi:hypothetical protein